MTSPDGPPAKCRGRRSRCRQGRVRRQPRGLGAAARDGRSARRSGQGEGMPPLFWISLLRSLDTTPTICFYSVVTLWIERGQKPGKVLVAAPLVSVISSRLFG